MYIRIYTRIHMYNTNRRCCNANRFSFYFKLRIYFQLHLHKSQPNAYIHTRTYVCMYEYIFFVCMYFELVVAVVVVVLVVVAPAIISAM